MRNLEGLPPASAGTRGSEADARDSAPQATSPRPAVCPTPATTAFNPCGTVNARAVGHERDEPDALETQGRHAGAVTSSASADDCKGCSSTSSGLVY